ncbi:MAG: hypothetical protein K9W43_02755 [Candidatus Thorarchaeota archaeon]|nr:hypothetical protein [Candidatus Thorarchaeota archaeon]
MVKAPLPVNDPVITMSVRAFPKTRNEPRKRILLIPILLLVLGYVLMLLHPYLSTGFFGAVISMAGVLSIFLVGMVFADLWAASKRTKDIIKAREARRAAEAQETPATGPATARDALDDDDDDDDDEYPDPFEEEIGDE